MNDSELNQFLRQATVPEREPEYWEQFPGRVTTELERRRQPPAHHPRSNAAATGSWFAPLRSVLTRPVIALVVAVVCLAVGYLLGVGKARRTPRIDPEFASARQYFRELAALFPNQLQAIVFDQQGAHLVLAAEPNLPASPPLYLKVCGPHGCQRFVTFSGQQIKVNGDAWDVLADGQGNILLVGQQQLWAGAATSARSGPYHIEARTLEARL